MADVVVKAKTAKAKARDKVKALAAAHAKAAAALTTTAAVVVMTTASHVARTLTWAHNWATSAADATTPVAVLAVNPIQCAPA